MTEGTRAPTAIDCSAPPPAPGREHERRHVLARPEPDDERRRRDLDPYDGETAWRVSPAEPVRRALRALGFL
ncbi:MAG: hypothetical protein JST00_20055 [Deltaproteobacteria bacterium]|nr:hypothetical protein [Deltaproteobacteria bacterium]